MYTNNCVIYALCLQGLQAEWRRPGGGGGDLSQTADPRDGWLLQNLQPRAPTGTAILLYTELFSPHVIFALLHLKRVSPHLKLAQTLLCWKRYHLRQWNLPSLKMVPLTTKAKRGKINWGQLSLYTFLTMKVVITLGVKYAFSIVNQYEWVLNTLMHDLPL